jgi:hypothetical protein
MTSTTITRRWASAVAARIWTRVGRDLRRRVETGESRSRHVVVDRLRNPHDAVPLRAQALRDPHRAVAAQADQPVEFQLAQVAEDERHDVAAVAVRRRIALVRRAEDRPGLVEDP